MLARFRASSPDRCPQAAKSPCHAFGTRRGWWEKRQLFEAGRTRPLRLVKPYQQTNILQLFRGNSCNGNALQKKSAPRENGLPHPAKGGSTPAFACQRAAIAPLPCPNLQLVSQRQSNCELASFKKCNCSRKNRLQNWICFANVGCSPTPRQHFWKTAAPKNFLFACGSLLAVMRFWCSVSRETLSGCTFNKFWKNGGN